MDRGRTLRSWAAGSPEGEAAAGGRTGCGGGHLPGAPAGTAAVADMARPGDGDLFCDVTGARVQTVFRVDNEFYLLLRDGRGWTTDPTTAAAREILPGELVESSFTYLPTHTQRGIVDEVEDLLRSWSADGTPVHLACALQRVGSLTGEDGRFVPLPPL